MKLCSAFINFFKAVMMNMELFKHTDEDKQPTNTYDKKLGHAQSTKETVGVYSYGPNHT